MTFHSILFEKPEDFPHRVADESPDFFVDLNIDQIVDTITAGKEEYNLKPFFYTILHNIEAIKYRQEIMQDLENKTLCEHIKSFAGRMHTMREYLSKAGDLHNKYQKERWFLDAVEIYCDAINSIVADLNLTDLQSRGLLRFREYIASYAQSAAFTSLLTETKKLAEGLSQIRYCLLIKNNTVEVRPCASEIDYSTVIEETFAKFKQEAVKDYRVKFYDQIEMNNVEENILDLIVQIYPDTFLNLDNYYVKNRNYVDETIIVFDREIQFYIAYLEYMSLFKGTGLRFCYPKITHDHIEIYDYEGFDLALAYKLINQNLSVVCNDFYLKDPERVIVVSGPNQGGKTTFARMFGQLHYLASLGCSVSGRESQLFLFDRLFTHFEKEETINNLSGKLEEDLSRINNILNQASNKSIIIMNEIFASTTLQDALFLSKKIINKIIQLDLFCVWVTFVIELASFNEKTVSMVAEIIPENPTERTFKIARRYADGLSYAMSIAEKYRLTYDHLIKRIKP